MEKFAGDVEVADQYNQRHDELDDVVHKLAEKRGLCCSDIVCEAFDALEAMMNEG